MKAEQMIGGLVGATVLTALNQAVGKIVPQAPRLDILGMNLAGSVLKRVQASVPSNKLLFPLALAGDLLGNSLYYGLVGRGTTRQVIAKGTGLGLAAGLAAVLIPPKTALPESTTSRTTATKIMTVAWYTLGGLAAGLVIAAITPAPDKKVKHHAATADV